MMSRSRAVARGIDDLAGDGAAVSLAKPALICYTFRDKMPRHRKPVPARPTPIQLSLFAETASLVRIRPALNEWRYDRMDVWPDLFGRPLLVRQWDRIDTEGRRRSYQDCAG